MKNPNTIKQLLTFTSKKIAIPDAELLLSHVLKKTREFIIANPKYKTTFLQKLKFKYYTKKRYTGIPLAYITGNKEFFGLNFKVNKHTLIPRPDTEILVEKAIKEIKLHTTKNELPTLIDIGTGSGCIPISILSTHKLENLKTYATDISNKALKIAKQNAKKHSTPITFLHGNLLEPIIKNSLLVVNCKLLIVANLPYLTERQFDSEPSIQHEPKTALVADNQGLALYEKLLEQVKNKLVNHCSQINILIEIDPTQTKKIISIIKKILPKTKISILTDLSGRDRVVHIRI